MKQIPHRLHSLLPSRSYEGYHNCPHTDTNQNMTDHFFCTCSGQWYNFPCIHRVSAVVKPQEQEVMTSSRSQYGHLYFGPFIHFTNKVLTFREINSPFVTGSNLRFADDVVLFSESPQELQLMVEELRTASNKVDLEINLSETKETDPQDDVVQVTYIIIW
ncbi:hypothetical protein GQR58_008385 [Nymphon striatum]|nr:hypothetical protein GQR58_008385 [Nymphon striatum]